MNSKVMFSSENMCWGTPDSLFDSLDQEFHFNLDPCADEFNHKCERYFTVSDDGLSQSWDGYNVFCNPPYGRSIGKWVRKAAISHANTVLLIPARTDTIWFHRYIYGKAEIRFLKGRLKFVGAVHNAPFPSMIVIFRNMDLDW